MNIAIRLCLLSCLLPACLPPVCLMAQQQPSPAEVQPLVWPPPPGQVPALKERPAPAPAPKPEPGRIALNVVVTDKAGNAISGLSRGDFTLLDNNRPATILAFHAYGGAASQAAEPTEVILVIDTVNMPIEDVYYSRYGVDQFLHQDGGRLAEPVSVIWLSDQGVTVQGPPSMDGNAVAEQLDATDSRLRSIGRTAGFWGAVERYQISVQMLERVVAAVSRQPVRKLVVWVGPGWPVLSGPEVEMTWKEQQQLFTNVVEMNTEIRDAEITLNSVSHGMPNSITYLYQSFLKGVKKPQQVYPADLDLKVLAVQSGGLAVPPSNDLEAQIESSIKGARTFYTLRFDPPRADGPNEYHELKVKVDKPRLTVRTNTGYYNQPPGNQPPGNQPPGNQPPGNQPPGNQLPGSATH